MEIKKRLPKIKENISLAKYTTFKIGGPAKYFFRAKTKKDLIESIKAAKEFKIPFFILGGGSNLLVADEGYRGLVIKIQNSKFKIQNENSKIKIHCEAGMKLKNLVKLSLKESLTGLEWAAGIPGTVGGAIYGAISAFGVSVAEIVKGIEVLDVNTFKIKNFSTKDYKPKYKDTIFKRKKNFIILSAIFQLKKGLQPTRHPRGPRRAGGWRGGRSPAKGGLLKKEIEKRIEENLNYRKIHHPLDFPSAGSTFKNPILNKSQKKLLVKLYGKELPIKKNQIPAGFLIEKCGLKGKKIGKAKISEKHANFIVNLGGARAKDVLKLIKLVKKEVKNKFGINLEEEIQYLGF